MCGRFTLTDPDADLSVQFGLPEIPDLEPRYNIAPTQPVAAVRLHPQNAARELAMLHWGLIPFWAKDPKIGSRMINARSETVAEKPAFRAAFRQRRCLIVADGFYEWQKTNGTKQPYYIRLHDARPFAFAGLWERWQGPESVIESCTLLTTAPNELLSSVHNRMPVILKPSDYDLWLDPDLNHAEMLGEVLRPFPSELMQAYPVSLHVNRPRNDDPRCIEPLAEQPGLAGLPGV
jgi:putative SOS response-associated peptidase YedK